MTILINKNSHLTEKLTMDFETELKLGFIEEATQFLQEAEECLLLLEKNPNSDEDMNKLFRIAHSLKGGAKAVGFSSLGQFTHVYENYLLKFKNREWLLTSEAISFHLKCWDNIQKIVEALRQDINASVDTTQFEAQVVTAMQMASVTTSSVTAINEASVEIDTSSIVEMREEDTSDFSAEPIVIKANSSEPKTKTSGDASSLPANQRLATEEYIRVSLARVDRLVNLLGESVIHLSVVSDQSHRFDKPIAKRSLDQLVKVTREVQELAMGLRMVPMKPTFQKLQRTIRDLAASMNKEVHVQFEGEETEIDKIILEQINDPLVHLVRNAIDHGVESREVRSERGKDEKGHIIVRAYHRSGHLRIEVSDDGGGIDASRIREKAIEKKLPFAVHKMTDKEVIQLIFHPGFSTKTEVSEVSGRGVGMDVVKSNVDIVRGSIEIDTEVKKGSTFRMILPLTLAIVDAFVVKACDQNFLVPISAVHETQRVNRLQITKHTSLGEVIDLRGEIIPTYRLSNVLGLKEVSKKEISESMPCLIVRRGTAARAIIVDEIVRQQQIVNKNLGAELSDVPDVVGSAILGDGRPALILEFDSIFNAA